MPFLASFARLRSTRPRRSTMRAGYGQGSSTEDEEPLILDLESSVDGKVENAECQVSLAKIYLLSIVNFGISAAWALEMAVTTPYFASALGSGPVLSHVVWVLGPISGLVVAPLVGYLSDNCTSVLGRRRPFIIVGGIGTFCGMIVFSNAREIADRFFPHAKHVAALIVAVVSFAVMDLSINTSMFPVRALQGDLVPERQQHMVQSATIVMGSLGDFSINLVLMFYNEPVAHLRFLFLLTAIAYLCTSLTMLIIATEEQYKPPSSGSEQSGEKRSCWGRMFAIPKVLMDHVQSIPIWLWRIGGAFALGFFAFFCVLPNASAWLGSSVLRGDPEGSLAAKKRYELGMAVVGKAGTVRALLSVVTAAVYPHMLKFVEPGKLFGIAFLLYGVVILLFAGTHSLFWGQFAVAAYAIPFTALLTIPMALTVKNSTKVNRGKHLGTLNIFAVVPQLIDTTYTGWVSKALGEAWVMRIGGFWSLLAAMFAFYALR